MLRDPPGRDKAAVAFVMPHPAFGGAERLAGAIMGHLAREGVPVVAAIATRDSRIPDCSSAWLAPHATIRRLDGATDLAATLLDLLAETNCGALVLYGRSPAYHHLPRIAAERPDLRLAAFQFNDVECVTENRLHAARLDVVIAESANAARALGPVPALVVIPSAVDVPALAARPRDRPPDAVPTVAFVGRFDQTKSPETFVRLVPFLDRPHARYVMAGSGPLWRTIQRRAGALQPPFEIALTGLLDDEALRLLMDRIDILVVPSRIDGRPLVVQEAQACGIAVVAHRVGGIPDLVSDEETGLLCERGDLAGLARAVRRLIDDPALRHRLGGAGRQRVLREGGIGAVLPHYAAAITGRA